MAPVLIYCYSTLQQAQEFIKKGSYKRVQATADEPTATKFALGAAIDW